ncbi:RING-H2 finger protein ATL51-like [Magnolia sinica]|uniref:RING-H2 finger protein ATL51-like n=1 Tax=Magnolia sinica TaxID=86752 RepID=UPI00265AB2B3|nr:RING-H2 finger protein ATL51-like [Magnolia sinica]
MRLQANISFTHTTWKAEQESEIEEPTLTLQVEVKNKYFVSDNSDRSRPPIIPPSTFSTTSFRTKMSAFLCPQTSHRRILRMLSMIGIAQQAIAEDLNSVISTYSRGRVEEVIRMGVNAMEIVAHIELRWIGSYDDLMDIDDGQAKTHGSKSLAKIEALLEKYKVKRWDERENCGICLDELGDSETEEVSVLSCSHPFHVRCLKRWLEESDSCPLCRMHI